MLHISQDAEQDLLDIWMYIAKDNIASADQFLDRLYQTIKKLEQFKDMGVNRPELNERLKSFPVESYTIFYTVKKSDLEVVRLHSARDIKHLL